MAAASAMLFVDETVLAVSLPRIQTDLNLTSTATHWLLLSYLVPFAALLLPAGRAVDVLGVRRVFLFGLYGFAVASVAAGMAQSMIWFCSARAVQGIGAAAIAVVAPAAISQVCPELERGRAMACTSGAISLALLSGPIIGGALTQLGSWRLVFFINLPVAMIILLKTTRLWRDVRFSRQATTLDVFGSVLVSPP